MVEKVENKKQMSIGQILGIVAFGVAVITIFLEFAPAYKDDYHSFMELFIVLLDPQSEKKNGLGACFIMILIGSFMLGLAMFMPNTKVAAYIKFSGSLLIFIAGFVGFFTIQIIGDVHDNANVELGAGPILVGIFGIITAGLGTASGILNLKHK